MEIRSGYNTPNFNGKVNFLTLMRNHFSKAGRHANQEIAEIKSTYPLAKINQEKVGDTIELSFHHADNLGTFSSKTKITSNGVTETEIDSERTMGQNKRISLLHTIKKRFITGSTNIEAERTETQVVYNNATKQVEECATKKTSLYEPTEIKVTTKAKDARVTNFPTTTIAGNLHPAQATKHTNADGDIVYIERYIKN